MEVNGYALSRTFFDHCFEHPEKVTPTHIAIYFFAMEHCNRLGWKEKFGMPTTMAMESIGIKSYKTYKKVLNELIEWGFIKMIQESKNQYSSNIIALVKNTKANTKALTKAVTKHSTKHVPKHCQSKVSIDKPLTLEPITINQDSEILPDDEGLDLVKGKVEKFISDKGKKEIFCMTSKITMPELESMQSQFLNDVDISKINDLWGYFRTVFNQGKYNGFIKKMVM